MAAEKCYYQVWVHHRQEMRVHLIGTYENENRACSEVGHFNSMEMHDTRFDMPPRNYYYMRVVSAEQLHAMEVGKHQFRHGMVRKRLKQKHHDALKPLTAEMAAAMVFCIETCDKDNPDRFYQGGWVDGYRGHADGIGDITCSAHFDGYGYIDLVVTLEDKKSSATVEKFWGKHILKSWLLNTRGAASSFEDCIIDTLYKLDRLSMLMEVAEISDNEE